MNPEEPIIREADEAQFREFMERFFDDDGFSMMISEFEHLQELDKELPIEIAASDEERIVAAAFYSAVHNGKNPTEVMQIAAMCGLSEHFVTYDQLKFAEELAREKRLSQVAGQMTLPIHEEKD